MRTSMPVFALLVSVLATACVSESEPDAEPYVAELDESAPGPEDLVVRERFEDYDGDCPDCNGPASCESVDGEPCEGIEDGEVEAYFHSLHLEEVAESMDLSALPGRGSELGLDEDSLYRELPSGERVVFALATTQENAFAVVRGHEGQHARLDVLPVKASHAIHPIEILERGNEIWVFGGLVSKESAETCSECMGNMRDMQDGSFVARWDGHTWTEVPWTGEDPIWGAQLSADGEILAASGSVEAPTWTALQAPSSAR